MVQPSGRTDKDSAKKRDYYLLIYARSECNYKKSNIFIIRMEF